MGKFFLLTLEDEKNQGLFFFRMISLFQYKCNYNALFLKILIDHASNNKIVNKKKSTLRIFISRKA